MPNYSAHIHQAALQELARLEVPVAQRIIKKIRWLAKNADNLRHEPLHGELSSFLKLRVGSYRIIYEVCTSKKIVTIHAIGDRKEVYRRAK